MYEINKSQIWWCPGVQVQQESLSEVILDPDSDGLFGREIFLPYKDETYIIPYLVKDWFTHLCVRSLRNLESQYQRFGITKVRNKSCGTAFMMHICLDSGIDIRSAHLQKFKFLAYLSVKYKRRDKI